MKTIKIPRYGLILIILISFSAGIMCDTVFMLSGSVKERKLKQEILKLEKEYNKNQTEIELVQKQIDKLGNRDSLLYQDIVGSEIK